MILHCVFLRFKSAVQATEKQAIYDSIRALADVIPGMNDVQSGPDVSPEGLNGGFRDGFIVRFENAEARDTYLVHPDHVAAGDRIVALTDGGLAGLMVFDMDV